MNITRFKLETSHLKQNAENYLPDNKSAAGIANGFFRIENDIFFKNTAKNMYFECVRKGRPIIPRKEKNELRRCRVSNVGNNQ